MSALTIGLILLSIGMSSVFGFLIGYKVGSDDTRQEILERDPWE